MKEPPVLPITRCRIALEEIAEMINAGLDTHTADVRSLAVQALGIVLELQAALAQSTATPTPKE